MMLGADISVTRLFFQALLPATLGNLFGGGLLFAAVYWYALEAHTSFNLGKREPDIGSKSAGKPAALKSSAVPSPVTSVNDVDVECEMGNK
jgi:hypothetical protein